jgi:transcriptional regulator with XRE-family HTH domain
MKVIEMKQSVPIDSERMISHRKLKCWSQSRLAQVSGVGERTIQRIESESKASYQNAQAIAGALELSLEELLAVTPTGQAEGSTLMDLIINKKAKFYEHIRSGNELLALAGSAEIFSFDEGHIESEIEAALVGSFAQNVQDWGDIYRDIEHGSRIEAAFQLTKELQELEKNGFFVFQYVGRLVSKIEGKPDLTFKHLSLIVMRKGAPQIITNNVGKMLIAVVDERKREVSSL